MISANSEYDPMEGTSAFHGHMPHNVETVGLNHEAIETSPLKSARKQEAKMRESDVQEIIKQFNESLDLQSQEKEDLIKRI